MASAAMPIVSQSQVERSRSGPRKFRSELDMSFMIEEQPASVKLHDVLSVSAGARDVNILQWAIFWTTQIIP
jgi:hypothetical protein